MFNPTATFPFCPDQTDFLCFRTEHGFAAVDLNLIEGFAAHDEDGRPYTRICLTNNSEYNSIESVPELVNRYAGVKAKRYALERAEREIIKPQALPPTPPAPTPTPPGGIVWKNKS